MNRKSPLLNTIVVLLVIYMLLVGGTFNGLNYPPLKLFSLVFLSGMVIYWLFYRQQQRWQWHTTPLDKVFILWAIAFAGSLIANIEDWRRISLGLWYVSFYIVIWLTLSDMLSSKALSQATVIAALLGSGLFILVGGYREISTWMGQWIGFLRSGILILDVPRPTSTLMNTNILGGFLVMLVPFILSYIISNRAWFVRLLLILYLVANLLLVIITASRGAWLSLLVSFPVWLLLIMSQRNLLSWSKLNTWWQGAKGIQRLVIGSIGLVGAALLVLLSGLLLSLSLTRGLNGRELIYEAAWGSFIEKPLTGSGLFTFGHVFAGTASFPPDATHAHAHNGLLQVASDLGLLGLFATAVTTWVLVRAIRRNWKTSSERLTLTAAIASLIGVVIHHMTDFTGFMPAIALIFLCVLCVACTPLEPKAVEKPAQRIRLLFVAGFWLVLLGIGFWSTKIYFDFKAVFEAAVTTRDYRAAADNLNEIISVDPVPAYTVHQAFLYGMAANEGDLEAARLSIDAYTNFTAIQPNYAFAWINLAALHWQLDEVDEAIASAQEAVNRAPRAAPYWMLLGRYFELSGNLDAARDAYSQALVNDADIMLLPEWNTTTLQQEFAQRQPSIRHQVFVLLRDKRVDEALIAWQNDPILHSRSLDAVVQALVSGSQGDYILASSWLERAQFLQVRSDDIIWSYLGEAWIAEWQGDNSTFEREISIGCNALNRDPLADGLYWQGTDILYLQYMRAGIQELHLPQTDFPRYSPLLWSLLNCP